MKIQTVIEVLVELGPSGKPIHEQLLVEQDADDADRYRLIRSPGLVLGLAADDVFALDPDRSFKLVQRGRNLCIQVFTGLETEHVAQFLTPRFASLGGRLDGKTPKELVYTVPVAVGFGRIEKLLHEVEQAFDGVQWGYGNVYDPTDGVTPLNWW